MQINPSIFREIDVRGIYPDEIEMNVVYRIAGAFVAFLEAKKVSGPIVVGRDARLSSPELHNAFIQGVVDQGRDVLDIGETSTPLFYVSVAESKSAGGAMITASHNPKEYNGIKFVGEQAEGIAKETGLLSIRSFAMRDIPRKTSQGAITPKDYSAKYIDFLESRADIKRKIKFVIDASNGSAGSIASKLLPALQMEAIPLFFNSDGNFPNHPPNPLDPKSIEVAGRAVVDHAAEFGVIIDADGDRIVFVDENGKWVRGDIVGGFFVDCIAQPGDRVVITKNSTKHLAEIIQAKGGEAIYSRVGNANIKKAMKEHEAVFGIEPSGHMNFKELHYTDSALLSLVYFLSFFSRANKSFKKTMASYQTYFHTGEINFNVLDQTAAMQMVRDAYHDGIQEEFDGLEVVYPDWWFLVRKSNTEPLLRLTVEAKTKELMEEKRKELENYIRKSV
ncbi:MAG: phosphomannomutase/phosphoglucomutase [bacterium]|nr:phosphomannomutase/phosphoglucomutase [bacterium]